MLVTSTELALFPLNVVLFPGMMLPLHIFEQRYQTMIKECIDSPDQMFGVILAKNKQAQAPQVKNIYVDDLHRVGTTARITAVEHLTGGRMNLITVGHERFVLKNFKPSKDDFLIGRVDPFPIEDDGNPTRIDFFARKLRPMVEQYINHLATASGEDLSNAALPNDPKALAYLAGTAVQGSLPDKQQILAAESLSLLMAKTLSVLDKENKILSYMLKAYQAHNQVQRLPFVDYSLN